MVKVAEFLPTDEASGQEGQTLVKAPEPLRAELVGKGHRFALLTFWVTKLSGEQARALPINPPPAPVIGFWDKADLGDSDVIIRDYDMVVRNGHVALLRSIKKRRVEGEFLLIGAAFQEETESGAASAWIRDAVTQVRLSAGLGAAIESVYETTDHLHEAQSSFESPDFTFHYYYSNEQDIDNSWQENASGFSLWDFNIKPEAAQLLHLSLEHDEPSVRFLLTWLALEAQIGGNGPTIQQYFQHLAKCPPLRPHKDKLLEEIRHLTKVRGELAHSGKFQSRRFDYSLLFLLLRITCLESVSQREAATLELIAYLSVKEGG